LISISYPAIHSIGKLKNDFPREAKATHDPYMLRSFFGKSTLKEPDLGFFSWVLERKF